jgi:hypothetical protein
MNERQNTLNVDILSMSIEMGGIIIILIDLVPFFFFFFFFLKGVFDFSFADKENE